MASGENNKPSGPRGGGGRSLLPGFIRDSFVRKFVITLLIVLLVVGGVSAYAYAQTTDQLAADAEAEYTGVAERDAGDITEWQSERSINVQIASEFPLLQTGDVEEIGTYLDGEQERLPDDVESIHLVDIDERQIIASSDGARDGTQINIREAPWAWDESTSDLGDDETYTSEVIEIHGEPTVAYVSPVPDTDGDEVLVLTSSLDGVVEGFSSPSEDSFTQVVNADGDVIAGELGLTELQRNLGSFEPYTTDEDGNDVRPAFLDHALEGNTGFMDSTEKRGLDQDYVTAYAPVETDGETELVVAVHVPTSHAFALQSDITTSMLALVLSTFIGLGFIGLTFGRGTVRSINELSTKAQALEDGNLDEEFEVKRTDEIGNLFRAFGSMRDALREQIEDAETARLQAEEAKTEAEEMNRHLETKADEYSEVMQEAADGDLTRRMDADSESDAMSEIATEFNEMLAEIETTVAELKTFAMEVAAASQEVTASSEEVRSASQQVTESIQEISDGAERQNDTLLSANTQLNDLSTSVDKIAVSSTEVAEIAQKTAQTGREGQTAAQNALEGMREIENESEGTVEAMGRLQNEIEQIDELLELITDIASQTNMLALNANIEASRSVSGDDSEGFGVVAQEIKELASETKDAAQSIEARLEQIQQETDRTATEVQTTRSQISRQTESVKDAAGALEEIADYAEETNTGVQKINTATQEQADATQQVVSVIDETATISEETTAESENVAAAAEQQTTALTEMSRSASDLSSRASQLSTALDRFGTTEDGGLGSQSAADDGIETSFQANDAGLETSFQATEDGTESESGTADDGIGLDLNMDATESGQQSEPNGGIDTESTTGDTALDDIVAEIEADDGQSKETHEETVGFTTVSETDDAGESDRSIGTTDDATAVESAATDDPAAEAATDAADVDAQPMTEATETNAQSSGAAETDAEPMPGAAEPDVQSGDTAETDAEPMPGTTETDEEADDATESDDESSDTSEVDDVFSFGNDPSETESTTDQDSP